MNNVIFFFGGGGLQRFINTVKSTNTDTPKYKTAPEEKKNLSSRHFQFSSSVMSSQIALTYRKLESTESAKVSTLYSAAQWGIELTRTTFYSQS